MKQEFIIDISEKGKSALEALQILSILDPNEGNHVANDLRPPLGIYNLSISRTCDKVIKCCKHLESYFNLSNRIEVLKQKTDLQSQIVDYLELSLYAAAEHVDDIFLIAKHFYSDKEYKRSRQIKILNNAIKKYKRLISASTNAIKHHQARLRLYSLEIKHGGIPHCLHGYFIEGVHNGVVGPSRIFHKSQQQIFSITSLMWEILCFLLNSSRELKKFLETLFNISPNENIKNDDSFRKAVIAVARLPLYSFDDIHPFNSTKISIVCSDKSRKLLESGIYGSIMNRWTPSKEMSFFGNYCAYVGDGVTKSFHIAKPQYVKLQHWT